MDQNMDSAQLLGVANDNAIDNLGKRMTNPKLMALRAQNPFIPILPFPNETLGLLLAANVAQDINVPSGAKMVLFSGNGEYFVSRKGNAQAPDGTAATKESGSFMNPELSYYYCEEITQF